MNKRYSIVVLLSIVVFLVACCSITGQYILNGCFWWECAPERNFSVLDWEIPLSLFPNGTFTDHITVPTDNMVGEIEGGLQSIYPDRDTIVVYDIYRFPRTKDAVAEFDHNKRNMIDRDTGQKWQVPSNLTFSSTTADDVYLACGYWSNRYRCQMTARYQEFIIFLNADINDKMTFGDFEKVAFYLDEQISSRLYP